MVQSTEEVESMLAHGLEAQLLGERERSWLDFKQSPHILSTPRGKVEFAKDVAALANSGGGCMVVGVSTRQDASDIDEVADTVSPFPCDMLNAAQCHSVLDSSVYPPIDGLRVESYARDGKCLGLIVVPPQDDDQLPVLLRRHVDVDNKPVDAVSLPSRTGSQTRWAPVGQIHRDLADGRRSRRYPPSTEPAEGEASSAVEPEDFAGRTGDRAAEIEAFMQWEDRAIYQLSAAPHSPPSRIEGFYDHQRLLGAFARPPELRHAGFGIGWSADPQIEEGALVASDSSRCRWLDPDGFFTVALAADQHMLGRTPRSDPEPHPLQVHPTALVEFTYDFCRFVAEQLVPHVEGSWSLGVLVRGARSRPWSLKLGRGSAFDHFVDGRPAVADEWLKTTTSSGEPSVDAYALLVRAYDLFGQPEDAIPHVEAGRVDVEAIIQLSNR